MRDIVIMARRARPISPGNVQALLYYGVGKFRRLQRIPFRFRADSGVFYARPVDAYAVEEVILDHEYACASRVVTSSSTQPVVVDGGANIGLFSIAILYARRDATVHSVEPDSKTFALLRRNAETRPAADWHVHHLALWRENGRVVFGNRAASTASRLAEFGGAETEEIVPCMTLEAFLDRHVRGRVTLLKLDIEGAEEAVLAHSARVLDRVDNLILEIHPNMVDEDRVRKLVHAHYPHVDDIPGRRSRKPLLFASRTYSGLPE